VVLKAGRMSLPISQIVPTSPTAQAAVELMRARVTVLIPEYRQVHVETADGRCLALTERTRGVALHELQVGQWLDCEVTLDQPHVVQARAVA
jgi:hypothetical protein